MALEQIAGLRMAYERRRTLPMWMTCTVVVRASDRITLERRSKRLKQRVNDAGAELRLLFWEQRAGWLAVVLLRYPPPPGVGFPWKRGLSRERTPGQLARWRSRVGCRSV